MSMYNLLATLSGAEIDYVLIGGLAVTLHGYQRVTMDVDVVLAMNDANLSKFVDCAKSANLKPVLPIPIDALRVGQNGSQKLLALGHNLLYYR